ncbi:MAG: ATP-binding cassette domain-containing protein [Minwuia sp.]|nr:ATP-binding cassette domain-containing protein [Minwuia sp.]
MSTAATSTGHPKISLKGVTKHFGPKQVLRGIDLDVQRGQSLVIIGGSGTGKSVMLKCILGLLHPDGGTIHIDGQDVTHLNGRDQEAVMSRMGMLFQGGALFDSLKVWENVAFGLIQGKGMPRDKARDIAMAKLAQVGLGADVGELSPAELSGGMQKRVGLARAIATDPEIIFFDEPTTGLDPIMGDVINDLIVKCVKELGATTMSITHDMASARKIADRVAMIYEGRIIWHGMAGDVDHSGNDHVDQFINGRAEGPIQMQIRKL